MLWLKRVIKDLPKHLKRLSETALALGRELVDRVWDLKAEVERRVNDMSNKKDDTIKSNSKLNKIKYLSIIIFSKNSHSTFNNTK